MKKELESKNGSENAIHFVDILMQHSELQTLTNADGATLRDQFMAENVQWILQQEQRNGHEKIFERHCFFTEQLITAGVDPRTAETDACRIEHIISDESFSRLKEAAEQEQT